MATRNIFDYTLATGAGSQTINVPLEHDISSAQALRLDLSLTAAATDVGDTLDIRFQESPDDGTTWDTRARFEQFLGNATVSAGAPERRTLVMHARTQTSTGESAYEGSGSAGASDLAAGTVLNGPFLPQNRPGYVTQPGTVVRQGRYRFNIAVVDGNSNGNFGGNIRAWSDTPEWNAVAAP